MISGPEIRLRILELMNINRERHVVLEDAEAFEAWVLAAPAFDADAPPKLPAPTPAAARTPRQK